MERCGGVGELVDDPSCQHLAQLDTPLIEGVDTPDDSLREHLVLVEGNQLPEHRGGQPRSKNHRRRPVAGEGSMRHQVCGYTRLRNFGRGLPEGESLRLSEEIRNQQIVLVTEIIGGGNEPDEVRGHDRGALVQQLIEGMLPVGPGLTPEDRAGIGVDRRPVEANRFAV